MLGLAFLILTARLVQLQFIEGEKYMLLADHNRFRLISVNAPRGVIYDREHRILVRNVPSFNISIIPEDLPRDKEDAVFTRLADLISEFGATEPFTKTERIAAWKQMAEQGRNSAYYQYTPIVLASDVAREVAFVVEEEHLSLPGVYMEIEPMRHYLDGPLTAHIIGYVGRIPKELAESLPEEAGYGPNDNIGLVGVERTYENELHGIKGRKHVEVDWAGREIRTMGELNQPRAGHNLILTIDLELQRIAGEALRRGMEQAESESGVVIAMNPQTGELLALVSLPSYDNNLFVGGISQDDYATLSNDPRHPLINHAISGQYPPGSIFKIITAIAGLEEEVITYNTSFFCGGTMWLPNKFFPDDPKLAQPFYCWNRGGHGSTNVVAAIAHSCDIFFYNVGGGFVDTGGLGIDRLGEYSRLFGFGAPTGVALPGESENLGLVPNDRWKRQTYGESWVKGDTYNASIGQGYILATPLQLVNSHAALANGGTLYRPQIVYEVRDAEGKIIKPFQPEIIRRIPASPENIEIVQEGLRAAVTGGTAYGVNFPQVAVAGKTGTAEFPGPLDEEGNLPTHAWFVAFAPFENPEIVVLTFVHNGGEGSQTAVPITAEILRHHFDVPIPAWMATPTPTLTTTLTITGT